MTESKRGLVALFKSSDETDSVNDRYMTALKENEFHGFLVQTLSFEFLVDNLKKCLLQPDKYSGFDCDFSGTCICLIAYYIINNQECY